MKCIKCGFDLQENDMFCPNCGQPVQKANENNNEEENQNMYVYDSPINQQTNYNGGQIPVQQMNYNHQPKINQANYGQQPYKESNKGNTAKICLIVILAIVIIAASIFVTYYVTSKMKDNNSDSSSKSKNNSTNTSSVENNNSDDDLDNDSGNVNSSSNKKSSSYKVKYKGFNLYIPDDLVYEFDYTNDVITIGDADSTWVVQLAINEGYFQKIKSNKNELSVYLSEEFGTYGATVSSAKTETINGVEYILFECSISGTNMLIGCAGLNSMYYVFFEAYNENDDFDREALKDISDIISNAEYIGDSSDLKTDETDIINVLKKAFELNAGE